MKHKNLTMDAKNYTTQHEEIGNLQRFVLDPKTRKITHIIFERGGLLESREYVLPMEWVQDLTEDRVDLVLRDELIKNLPNFKE